MAEKKKDKKEPLVSVEWLAERLGAAAEDMAEKLIPAVVKRKPRGGEFKNLPRREAFQVFAAATLARSMGISPEDAGQLVRDHDVSLKNNMQVIQLSADDFLSVKLRHDALRSEFMSGVERGGYTAM